MFLLAFLANVAEIHLARRLLSPVRVLLREGTVTGELAPEAPLRFCGLAARAALGFFYRVFRMLPAEGAVAPLNLWYYHH